MGGSRDRKGDRERCFQSPDRDSLYGWLVNTRRRRGEHHPFNRLIAIHSMDGAIMVRQDATNASFNRLIAIHSMDGASVWRRILAGLPEPDASGGRRGPSWGGAPAGPNCRFGVHT